MMQACIVDLFLQPTIATKQMVLTVVYFKLVGLVIKVKLSFGNTVGIPSNSGSKIRIVGF